MSFVVRQIRYRPNAASVHSETIRTTRQSDGSWHVLFKAVYQANGPHHTAVEIIAALLSKHYRKITSDNEEL